MSQFNDSLFETVNECRNTVKSKLSGESDNVRDTYAILFGKLNLCRYYIITAAVQRGQLVIQLFQVVLLLIVIIAVVVLHCISPSFVNKQCWQCCKDFVF